MSGTTTTTTSSPTIPLDDELTRLNEALSEKQKNLASLERDQQSLEKQMDGLRDQAAKLSSNPISKFMNRKELADINQKHDALSTEQYDKFNSAKYLRFDIEDTQKAINEHQKAQEASNGKEFATLGGKELESSTSPELASLGGKDLASSNGENVASSTAPELASLKGPELASSNGKNVAPSTAPELASLNGKELTSSNGKNVEPSPTNRELADKARKTERDLEQQVSGMRHTADQSRKRLQDNLDQTKALEAQRDKLNSSTLSKLWNRRELNQIDKELSRLEGARSNLDNLVKTEDRLAKMTQDKLDDHRRENGMDPSRDMHQAVGLNRLNQLAGNNNAEINLQQRVSSAISNDPQLKDLMGKKNEIDKQLNAALEKGDQIDREWANLKQKGMAIEAQGKKGDKNALKDIEKQMDRLADEHERNNDQRQSLGHQSGVLKQQMADRMKEVENSVRNPGPKVQGNQEQHHESVREALHHEAELHGHHGPQLSQPHQGMSNNNNSAGVHPQPQLTPDGALKYKAPDKTIAPEMVNSGFSMDDLSKGKGLTDGARVQPSGDKPKVDGQKHENVGEKLHLGFHGHGDKSSKSHEVGAPQHQQGHGVKR